MEDVQPEPEVEAVPAQVEAEAEVSEEEEDVDEDEIDARKITQKEINAYWVAKEKASKAPTYHHKDLSVREKILREFDMNSQYGVRYSLLLWLSRILRYEYQGTVC